MPLLTIGLPTSATAAVIPTAFQSYGLQPGPQLFTESGPLVYALLASLYIGNVMLLVLCVIGLLGVLMALAEVPVAPAVVGLILGPLFEEQVLRAVLISEGSVSGLFSTTLSVVLWVIAAIAVVVPFAVGAVRRSRRRAVGPVR